jgi:hypothetical protein
MPSVARPVYDASYAAGYYSSTTGYASPVSVSGILERYLSRRFRVSDGGIQSEEELDRLLITMGLLMLRRMLLKSSYPTPIKVALRERCLKLLDKYSDYEVVKPTDDVSHRHPKGKGR